MTWMMTSSTRMKHQRCECLNSMILCQHFTKCRASHAHHALLPFYDDNREVLEQYKERDDEFCKQVEILSNLLVKHINPPNPPESLMYHTVGDPSRLANQLSEDVWSKRLCGCLQLLYPEDIQHLCLKNT